LQKVDFLHDGGVPAGHEIGEFVLQEGPVDLKDVRLVDEAEIGTDIVVGHSIAESLQSYTIIQSIIGSINKNAISNII